MLLSKHEISVLAKHPKLKQFIFEADSWLNTRYQDLIDERKEKKEWAAEYRRRDGIPAEDMFEEVSDSDAYRAQCEYCDRDMCTEVTKCDAPVEAVEAAAAAAPAAPGILTHGTLPRRRRLDESLVTEASFMSNDDDDDADPDSSAMADA
jgi:hypothetical protein